MSETFEHGYALVIGVDDNQIKRLALPTVGKDVAALRDVLVHPQRCAYPRDQVRFLSGPQASKANILDALSWLRGKVNADPQATAVIYYSGHGMEDKEQDRYYLVPYDMRGLASLHSDAIEASLINGAIAAITPPRLLAIFDCCHAAGLDVKEIAPQSLDAAPAFTAGAFPAAIPAQDIPEYTAEPGSKDVADLTEGRGRAVLNSSTGAQSSYIRQDGKMSLFTYHLIEALSGHAPHPDDATVVYVTDVMSWVTHQVKKSAAREGVAQTPVMYTSGVFPVAQLLGGEGVALSKGEIPPGPLEPLPQLIFNQQGQSVGGHQLNIGESRGDIELSGDVITTGNITGSSGVAIGRGASASVTVSSLPVADDTARRELEQLVQQLNNLLEQAPPQLRRDADAVAQSTQMLLDAASAGEPNPAMVQGTGNLLRQTAQAFKDDLPQIVEVAGKIAVAAAALAGARS